MPKETRIALIIDDDPRVHDLLDFHLEGVVDRILHARRPRDGLLQAAQRQPDVILLDLEMPLMDGFEVCRALKDDERTRHIPVLFLTADRRVHHIARALDSGGMDYIIKPFEVIELQARIRSALRMRRLVRTLEERARLDALTGLDNRIAFEEGVQGVQARFIKERTPFSLLFAEVDQARALNESFGHSVGDEALRAVAGVLSTEAARVGGRAARYEGGEFAVLVPGVQASRCTELGDRIRRSVAAEVITAGDRVVQVTASIGLMGAPRVPRTGGAAACIALARAAMAQAREAGGNELRVQQQRTLSRV